MDEYKFVNPSASVKAYTLPPAYPDKINFQPPTLPQNWGDKGVEGRAENCRPNDHLDNNVPHHNYTFGHSIHDIQKV